MAQPNEAAGAAEITGEPATLEDTFASELDQFLEPVEAEEEEAATEEAEVVEGEESEAEEVEAEAEEGEEAEGEEEAAEPVAAPHSWSKEDKELFKALPPEAQAVIARRETERDQFVQRKSEEAARTRMTVENEAREILAQQSEQYAQRLQQFETALTPQAPDERLLYTGNQEDLIKYQRQEAAYRRASAQKHQLQQQAQDAFAEAEAQRKRVEEAEVRADAQRLHEQLPEWFDPSEGPKLRDQLQSIGAEMGYPAELMAEARSVDILALKKVSEWKAKADKLDSLNKSKMEAVRAAKGLPKMVKPGAKPNKAQASATARDAAWKNVLETRDPGAMADWLEKSGIL